MILDYTTILSDAQAITTSAASTNTIDTVAAGDALLGGSGAMCQFLIDTTITSSQSISVTFDLQTATDSAFTSPVTLASSGAISRATLITGNVPFQPVIPAGCLRFLRGYYTSNGTIQAGKVDARIVIGGDSDVTVDKIL